LYLSGIGLGGPALGVLLSRNPCVRINVMSEANPADIPKLTIAVQDQSRDYTARESSATSLVQIAQTNPDYRGQCIAILTATLERYQRNPIELNTSLIGHLMSLKASESAALVQQVVKAGEYDKAIGDWARISRELDFVEKRPEAVAARKAAVPARAVAAGHTESSAPLAKPEPPEKPVEFFSPNPAAAAATIAAGPRLSPKEKDKLRSTRKQERKAKKQNRRR